LNVFGFSLDYQAKHRVRCRAQEVSELAYWQLQKEELQTFVDFLNFFVLTRKHLRQVMNQMATVNKKLFKQSHHLQAQCRLTLEFLHKNDNFFHVEKNVFYSFAVELLLLPLKELRPLALRSLFGLINYLFPISHKWIVARLN
jgi:hypothetical protein